MSAAPPSGVFWKLQGSSPGWDDQSCVGQWELVSRVLSCGVDLGPWLERGWRGGFVCDKSWKGWHSVPSGWRARCERRHTIWSELLTDRPGGSHPPSRLASHLDGVGRRDEGSGRSHLGPLLSSILWLKNCTLAEQPEGQGPQSAQTRWPLPPAGFSLDPGPTSQVFSARAGGWTLRYAQVPA